MSFYDKRFDTPPGEDDFCDLAERLGDFDPEANGDDLNEAFLTVAGVTDGFQVQEAPDDPYTPPPAPRLPGEDEDDPPPPPSTPEQCEGYLRRFFAGKSMHCGGPISEHHLLSEKHVEMVLRLELSDCLDIFHDSLDENIHRNRRWRSIRHRVELFKRLEAQAAAQQIPKHHIGGLLLVYLILCKGYAL